MAKPKGGFVNKTGTRNSTILTVFSVVCAATFFKIRHAGDWLPLSAIAATVAFAFLALLFRLKERKGEAQNADSQ